MEIIIIAIIACGAAMLTFFSGFGLGTILMPVFAIFFPVEIAIALTAIVHLANNLFKISLLWQSVNKHAFMLFALPAMAAAVAGAMVLDLISREIIIFSYNMAGREFRVTLLRLVISFLLIVFAFMELDRRPGKFNFGKKYLPLGGVLSGFFGGLSGHQGALRSMFLLRAGLDKNSFIATGIAAATLIDISRISVYGKSFFTEYLDIIDISTLRMLMTAILAAFTGSLAGRLLLRKVTMRSVSMIVGYMIIVLALLMGAGII
jgi:uncharacterized protein